MRLHQVFDSNGLGNLSAGGQLRLIKVLLVATGPADRLVQNIQPGSTPALSQPQLMALIVETLWLVGVGAGTAIAAVSVSRCCRRCWARSQMPSVSGCSSLYPTYVHRWFRVNPSASPAKCLASWLWSPTSAFPRTALTSLFWQLQSQ